MLNGRQIRAARALLDWSQVTLSERSGVSIAAIRRLEPQRDSLNAHTGTLVKIEEAFSKAGVFITNENGDLLLRYSSRTAE